MTMRHTPPQNAPSKFCQNPLAVALLALLFAAFLSQNTVANRPGFPGLDHVVDAATFDALCEDLNLSEAQRHAAARSHATYFEAIRVLQAERQAKVSALRQWQRQAMAAGDRSNDEIAVESLNRADTIWKRPMIEADRLLLQFYQAIQPILTDEQIERFARTKRLVRRMNWRGAPSPDSLVWFGRSPDPFVLFDAACDPKESGELAPLMERHVNDLADRELQARRAIETVIIAAEIELDANLQRREQRMRAPEHFTLKNLRDPERVKRGQREASLRRAILNGFVRDVALIIEPVLGAEARRAWELRYWRNWHNGAFASLPLDDFEPWLAEAQLPEAHDSALREMYAAARTRLHEARRGIFSSAMEALDETGRAVGIERSHIEVMHRITVLVQEHDASVAALAALVDENTRERLTQRFVVPNLARTLASGARLHAMVEGGIIDPQTYRVLMPDPQTGEPVRYRLRQNGAGLWDTVIDQ